MKKKKLQKWNFTIAALGGLAGMILGTFIFSVADWSAILGAFTAFVIIFIINLVYVKSKKDQTPEVDERIRLNMRKYYAVIANVFIGILFVALAVLTYMGYEQVSLMYLWMSVVVYMVVSGIGALVVIKR
ncbi:hypothetical protein KP77_12050 [Jeotgalibacillus alimentarius]|uniref:DUF2178 domain-containing protein n=1 Tax=Jeotgalibacillus alimentarius TaxID=135826 RepID=A0A0C2W6N2_9BACL|nr:hypothetical protein [Jeotgalibacillus alimentarius]KIL51693.1 hypothetical protein KP77_12050 [Jeotgalibacillus alimentarius]